MNMPGSTTKKVLKINPWFRWAVILVTGYTMIKGLILSVITYNPEGLIPIAMGSVLLYIIYKKSIHTPAALVGWALYFIIKYGVVFMALILSHHHNDYKDIESIVILEKLAFLLIGIVIWISTYRYVEVHEIEVPKT